MAPFPPWLRLRFPVNPAAPRTSRRTTRSWYQQNWCWWCYSLDSTAGSDYFKDKFVEKNFCSLQRTMSDSAKAYTSELCRIGPTVNLCVFANFGKTYIISCTDTLYFPCDQKVSKVAIALAWKWPHTTNADMLTWPKICQWYWWREIGLRTFALGYMTLCTLT